MESILITGSNGVLGTKLIQAAIGNFDVIATDLQAAPLNACLGSFTYASMDVTDEHQVEGIFQKFSPAIVIHAGAYTDVDGAEKNRDLCYSINVTGTQNVAKACKGKLVYISTDYVFDGTAGPYGEEDPIHTLGWYGETKYQGEQVVLNYTEKALICRTSTLYGFAPHITRYNFVGWLIRQLEQCKPVKVATDQYVNHTAADDLARVLLDLLAFGLDGVFHAAGEDRLSRFEFALRVADFFNFDRSLILPVTCAELGWTALRPLQGGLLMDKLHGYAHMMDTSRQLEVIKKTFPWSDPIA